MVAYKSAHVTGPAASSVVSEKIVQSYHSTQSTPGTISEVRRILYEHLGIPCGLECEVVERVDAASPRHRQMSRTTICSVICCAQSAGKLPIAASLAIIASSPPRAGPVKLAS